MTIIPAERDERERERERGRERDKKQSSGGEEKMENSRQPEGERERGREGVKGVKTLIEGNKWKERVRVTEKEKEPKVVGVPLVPKCAHTHTHTHTPNHLKTHSLHNLRSV